jgi:hypothetical protein
MLAQAYSKGFIKMKKIIHVLAYYIVWFGCLFFAKANYPWAGLSLSVTISLFQIGLLFLTKDIVRLAYFLLMFALIGYAIDTFLSISQLIYFAANPWEGYLAPPWILGLWLNFSILCFVFRDVLNRVSKFFPIIAFIGFPLAYGGGVTLGVAVFSKGIVSALLLGAIWMIVFPFLFYFCHGRHLDGHN